MVTDDKEKLRRIKNEIFHMKKYNHIYNTKSEKIEVWTIDEKDIKHLIDVVTIIMEVDGVETVPANLLGPYIFCQWKCGKCNEEFKEQLPDFCPKCKTRPYVISCELA